MGMQIAAVSAGSGITTAVQDIPRERARQARTDAMQAASLKQFEASLPGRSAGEARPEDLRAAAADLENIGLTFNRKLKFVMDHDSKEILVKVIDSETDKVIKVLPPEELQRLHSRIKETIGFLFDKRV